MPKVTGPLLSVEAHKALGKALTFQRRPGGASVYGYKKPKVPLTWQQLGQRWLVRYGVLAWQSLTDEVKAAWELKASGRGQSGYSLFLHENIGLPEGIVLYQAGVKHEGATVYDLSGYANHGTIIGATWVRLASGIWCLSFDGANQYVSVAADASIRPVSTATVEFWLRLNSLATTQFLSVYSGSDYSGARLHFRDADQKINFLVAEDGSNWKVNLLSDAGLSVDTFYHIVGLYEPGRGRLYVDGVEQAATSSATGNIYYTGSPGLHFGIAGDGALYDLNGYMPLRRIYNRALSATEPLEHFNAEKGLFGK